MKVRVVDTWTDDHLPCIGLVVNKRKVSLWWTDTLTIGALTYTDSKRARASIARLLVILSNPDVAWQAETDAFLRKQTVDNPATEDTEAQTRQLHTDWGMLEWGTELTA